MPCSRHVSAISFRSSRVKADADPDRMFSRPTPKYTESAPAWMAAARLSRLPTGAIISKSLLVAFIVFLCYSCSKYWINSCGSNTGTIAARKSFLFRVTI